MPLLQSTVTIFLRARLCTADLANIKQNMAYNLLYGFMSPGIDNFAHIGGFIGETRTAS